MPNRFTDSVEPFALATQRRTIEGKMPLTEMRRLSTLLRSSHKGLGNEANNAEGGVEGNVEFTLLFDIDEGGVPRIGGNVSTTIVLQCQRCMEGMDYPVVSKVRLGIVPSHEAAENLPDNYDPLVVSGDEISIASILEDEIMLALPIVAMHEIESCPHGETSNKNIEGSDQEVEQKNMASSNRENPFAVLAQLKKTQSGK